MKSVICWLCGHLMMGYIDSPKYYICARCGKNFKGQ